MAIKHDPTICYTQETHFKHNIGRLNAKEWRTIYLVNINYFKIESITGWVYECQIKLTPEQRKLLKRKRNII